MTLRSYLVVSASLIALGTLAESAQSQRGTPRSPSPPATIHQSEQRVIGKQDAADSLPRTLSVALPRSYADSAKAYPVVYVLDADGVFPMVSDIARVLAIGGEIPELIVVGIGYDRPYMETLGARNRDYTPTAMPARAGSGQAPRLLRYLTNEVFPFVDSLYRTLPGDRSLVGHSLGATFALHALLEAPAAFRRMVIGSPPTWDGSWLARRDSILPALPNGPKVAVYLSVGGAETQSFLTSWRRTVDLLSTAKYQRFSLTSEILPGESHTSAMGIATTHGLKLVFK